MRLILAKIMKILFRKITKSSQNCCVDGVNHNIFDVRVWDGLDSNIKELVASKGVVRETNINYPKDRFGRHLSCEHYIRKLQNGDSYDRKWLFTRKSLIKYFVFVVSYLKPLDLEVN